MLASLADKMATPLHILRLLELPVELEGDTDDGSDDEERQRQPLRSDCLKTQPFQIQVELLKQSHPRYFRCEPSIKGIGAKAFSPSDLLESCPILDSDDSDDDCSSSPAVAAKRADMVPQEVFEAAVQELRKKSPQLFAGDHAERLCKSAGFLTHPRRPLRNRYLKASIRTASHETMTALARRLRQKQLTSQLTKCATSNLQEKEQHGPAGEGSTEFAGAFSSFSSSSDVLSQASSSDEAERLGGS